VSVPKGARKKGSAEGRKQGTGRFVPCVGNSVSPPMHGMPVFVELFPTANGGYFSLCGVCGTRTFYNNPNFVGSAYTPEVIRAGSPPNMPRPVTGQGQMI
jgi:hypothetical protein